MPNRSELSETYDRLMGLVGQLLGLNEEERNFVLDRVAPLPETATAKTKKKPPKGSSRSSAKSPRAQSLSGAIQRAGKGRVDDGDNDNRCAHRFTDIPGGKTCGSEESSGIHDPKMGYSGYHPFVVPSPAPPALRRSSANGVSSAPVSGTRRTAHTLTVENDEQESQSASSSTTSSATETEDVSSAVHAGG